MNAQLSNKWQQGLCPFDGPVLIAGDDLNDDALRLTVRCALLRLHRAHGASRLYVNEDWHNHDGFITPEQPVSWKEAISWTDDIPRLRNSCSDDWCVHTLLFSENHAFCLRYWLDDDEGCLFDLSTERTLLEDIASSLRADGVSLTIEPAAKDYFDRGWAG